MKDRPAQAAAEAQANAYAPHSGYTRSAPSSRRRMDVSSSVPMSRTFRTG